jgi:sulfatase maturation enzyme AslB (radical SAM superfamily)
MKCSAFWKHANIRPGNRIYPCCRYKTPVADFNGNLDDVIHSTAYEELRQASANGEHIAGCEKCYYEESIGHKSLRQEINEQYDSNSVSLEYLEIGFDNLCNLTCDGCNSEFSTSWAAKEKLIYGKPLNKKLESLPIKTVPSSVNKILFLGGEPLMTDKHYDLIKTIKDPVEIVYNTNATFIPNATCTSEMSRHNTRFIISIDGVAELNEKVRSGTKWTKVIDFLSWVQENKFDFEFNTVLHKNNFHGIFDLHEFIKKYNKKWYVNILTYPDNLDITNLSKQKLQEFLLKLKKYDIPNKQFIINHITKEHQ